MAHRYENLRKPLVIRGHTLKSRLVYPIALPHVLQGPELYPADPVVSFYTNIAKNGASLILYHDLTNPKQRTMAGFDGRHFAMWDPYDFGCQNYFCQLADFVHFYGTLIASDICCDMQQHYSVNETTVAAVKDRRGTRNEEEVNIAGVLIGPEGVCEGDAGYPGAPAEYKEMFNDENIETYLKFVVDRALLYKGFGFDCAHVDLSIQYICGQFINPDVNKRTDKYGGSFENRMRFPLELLRRVRAAVGENHIIAVNCPTISEDGLNPGLTMEECAKVLIAVSPYVDLIHLRDQFTGDPEGAPANAALQAAKLKALGVTTPFAVNTPYMDLDKMDEIIELGQAEMIAASRMFLCNDDIGEIIEEERGEDLAPCLRCDICHGISFTGDWISSCTINPIIGRKHRMDRMVEQPGSPKRIAVVGGGPGGMYAALTLKKRGHDVVLYEKSDALGGQIKTARYTEFKWRLRRYLDWLIDQMDRKNVEYHLNTEATPEMISEGGFDIVIAALGATPKPPAVEGAEFAKWNIISVYGNSENIGHKVVVIGGSSGAAEGAIYLAQLGHEVIELSRKNIVGYDLNPVHARGRFNELSREAGVTLIGNAKTVKIEPNKVWYVSEDGNTHYIECDDILAAGGMEAACIEAEKFYGCAKQFYTIGDARQAGTMRTAIRDAYALAVRI